MTSTHIPTEPDSNLDGQVKKDFKQRVKDFIQLPSVFHGALIGGVLFAAKIVFYFAGNWNYIFDGTFMFFSFATMLYAIFMAARSEKQIWGSGFNYLRALKSGLRVVVVAVTFSIAADAILYNLDSGLASQTIQIQMDKAVEAFNEVKFIKEADKDIIISELKKQQPGSASALVGAWMGKILMNLIWIVFTSLLLRYRSTSSWLNTPSNEG